MASAAPSGPHFLLLLFLLSSFVFSSLETGSNSSTRIVAKLSSLIPADACSTPKRSTAGSLKITHKYGPCSPLLDHHHADVRELLLDDELRVASLQQQLVGSPLQASKSTLPVHRGLSLRSGNYLVTVGIGTPSKDQIVVFDTGSTVSWIQCRPCLECHQQSLPVFDPSASSSYRNVSCSASPCSQLRANGCSAGSCLYGVRYGDGSETVGFFAQETLTLTASDVFPNFLFGCGQRNNGLFGETSGLLGLSRKPLSLVSQTSSAYNGVFSYCLPASQSSTGELTFGPGSAGGSVAYTPMLTDGRNPGLYFLELTGISVGGQMLPISPAVFSTAGTLIDSGTVITRLPPAAYEALRTAFRSGMSEYTLGEPLGLLDTCYDMTGRSEFSAPRVALQLGGGVEVRLGVAGTFFLGGEEHVCLAFAANHGEAEVGVIGNIQQRTMQVVYDVGGSRIGFAGGSCA